MAHVETVACLCTEHPGPPPSDGHQTEPDHQAPETVGSSSHHDDPDRTEVPRVTYVPYESELQMPDIMRLMKADLSEPYSIYTYRYFIHNWPRLCILAQCDDRYVGAIVCKLEPHHYNTRRGYIAMLAVDKDYRKRKIGAVSFGQTPSNAHHLPIQVVVGHKVGSTLVKKSIRQMVEDGCDEVVLETEVTNQAALSLYENLGFVRDKYLHQYYLNGVDAYRLKLWLKDPLAE